MNNLTYISPEKNSTQPIQPIDDNLTALQSEDTLVRGNFYSTIRKIASMDEIANFIMEHTHVIPKYADVIIETINKITSVSAIHYTMVLKVIEKILTSGGYARPIDVGGVRDNSTSDQYLDDSDPNRIDETELNSFTRVLTAYALKVMHLDIPYKTLNYSGKYSNTGDFIYKDSDMAKVLDYSIKPYLLLLTSPAIVDARAKWDQNAVKEIIDLVADCRSIYYDTFNFDEIVSLCTETIPSFTDIVSNLMHKNYSQSKDYCRKLMENMEFENSEAKYSFEGALDSICSTIRYIYSAGSTYLDGPSVARIVYNRYITEYRKSKATALGKKYFGNDAYLVYSEPGNIYQSHMSREYQLTEDLANLIVSRILAYVDMISKTYQVDKKIVKLFVGHGLQDALVYDITEQKRVDILDKYNKAISNDKWIECDESNQKYIDDHFWMFMTPADQDMLEAKEAAIINEMGEDDIAIESSARRKIRSSVRREKVSNKVYGAYKNYKDREQQADHVLTGLLQNMKKLAVGDVRTEIIEGKNVSAIGLMKKAIGAMAVCSALGPVKAVLAFIVRYFAKKKVSRTERLQILAELDSEIEICEEKIEDAAHAGHTKEKYKLMRIKAELERARSRIRLGMGNVYNAAVTVKEVLSERRGSK